MLHNAAALCTFYNTTPAAVWQSFPSCMRVALVHDYLNQYGGAERVLEALHELFPDAPVYTSIYDPQAMPAHYHTWDIRTSWMQHLPAWRTLFRAYLPCYPFAFERFDLHGYDLIISSSSAFAKGIVPAPGTRHLCYCHTPMRFAWRTTEYVKREQIPAAVQIPLSVILRLIRRWDVASSRRVDRFIANSHEVAGRIRHSYGRAAVVIPPPVDLPPFVPQAPGEYYLAGGRMVPYKRLDLVVQALTALRLPLKIFGDGRDRAALEALAGPNIEFLGFVSETRRQELMAGCRAFLFPGNEDFGITPVEAMAAGRPVIAYAAGGALDTVVDGITGRFFHEQSAAALAVAVAASRSDAYDPAVIRRHAEQFGRHHFLARMRAIVEETRC